MKKLLKTLLVCLLVLSTLVSCGEGEIIPPNPDQTVIDPDNPAAPPDEGTEDEPTVFTVSLSYRNNPYVPAEELYAQWTDGFSVHSAKFDENGVASITGLDGDFRVNLSKEPDGLTYNPNAYIATNNTPDVTVELQKISTTRGTGSSLYDGIIEISSVGVYRTTLTGASQVVYYQFAPKENGVYTIESWADVIDNTVNPRLDVYNGSSAYKVYAYTINDGGESGNYTKNFKYEITVDDSNIGQVFAFGVHASKQNGEYPVTLDFAVTRNGSFDNGSSEAALIIPTQNINPIINYSPSKYTIVGPEVNVGGNNIFDGKYYQLWEEGTGMPMVTDTERDGSVASALSGEYRLNFEDTYKTIIFNPESEGATKGTVDIKHYRMNSGGAYDLKSSATYAYQYLDNEAAIESLGRIVLVELLSGTAMDFMSGFTIDDEGNLGYGIGYGYYHRYDPVNGTYGPILYAYITTACRFIDRSFTTIEQENKALTVSPTENYKLFIEGISGLLYDPLEIYPNSAVGPYLCNHNCPCRKKDNCDTSASMFGKGACGESCRSCRPDCRRLPDEAIEILKSNPNVFLGYAGYANSDGLCPVTPELKDFLQKFSISQNYFMDGNGWVESNDTIDVYATEDDQWLFACAYYKEK